MNDKIFKNILKFIRIFLWLGERFRKRALFVQFRRNKSYKLNEEPFDDDRFLVNLNQGFVRMVDKFYLSLIIPDSKIFTNEITPEVVQNCFSKVYMEKVLKFLTFTGPSRSRPFLTKRVGEWWLIS